MKYLAIGMIQYNMLQCITHILSFWILGIGSNMVVRCRWNKLQILFWLRRTMAVWCRWILSPYTHWNLCCYTYSTTRGIKRKIFQVSSYLCLKVNGSISLHVIPHNNLHTSMHWNFHCYAYSATRGQPKYFRWAPVFIYIVEGSISLYAIPHNNLHTSMYWNLCCYAYSPTRGVNTKIFQVGSCLFFTKWMDPFCYM